MKYSDKKNDWTYLNEEMGKGCMCVNSSFKYQEFHKRKQKEREWMAHMNGIGYFLPEEIERKENKEN